MATVQCAHCKGDFLRTQKTGPLFHCSDLCRLLDKIEHREGSDCWWWTAALDPAGYGNFQYGGRVLGAHRVSYILHRGGVDSNLQLDHLCRNPACVNPAHLEPVTQLENQLRGLNTRLTEADVLEIRRLRAEGMLYREIAPLFGISNWHAQAVAVGDAWGHLPNAQPRRPRRSRLEVEQGMFVEAAGGVA